MSISMGTKAALKLLATGWTATYSEAHGDVEWRSPGGISGAGYHAESLSVIPSEVVRHAYNDDVPNEIEPGDCVYGPPGECCIDPSTIKIEITPYPDTWADITPGEGAEFPSGLLVVRTEQYEKAAPLSNKVHAMGVVIKKNKEFTDCNLFEEGDAAQACYGAGLLYPFPDEQVCKRVVWHGLPL